MMVNKLFLDILEGEHEDTLKWPLTGTYFIESTRDKNHYTLTLNIGSEDKTLMLDHLVEVILRSFLTLSSIMTHPTTHSTSMTTLSTSG